MIPNDKSTKTTNNTTKPAGNNFAASYSLSRRLGNNPTESLRASKQHHSKKVLGLLQDASETSQRFPTTTPMNMKAPEQASSPETTQTILGDQALIQNPNTKTSRLSVCDDHEERSSSSPIDCPSSKDWVRFRVQALQKDETFCYGKDPAKGISNALETEDPRAPVAKKTSPRFAPRLFRDESTFPLNNAYENESTRASKQPRKHSNTTRRSGSYTKSKH